MGKNIPLSFNSVKKTDIAIACALMMLAGFLFSRVLLSVGVILFGLNSLWDVHPREWLKNKWWLIGLVWIGMYLLSGLWSEDMQEWGERVSVKLPILLLPISFSVLPAFSQKQIRAFTILAACLYLITIGYSVSFLIADPSYYIEQYRFSKVLPTLASKDYIRYSLSISLFIIWCFSSWRYLGNKLAKWFIGFIIVILSIYIHIIAVKTGVLVLYSFFLIWGLYLSFTKKPIIGIVLITTIFVSAIGAYKYVPTFTQKVDYFRFSWKVLSRGEYNSNFSDIGRVVSYDITRKVLPEYIWAGAGAGDIQLAMNKGYDKWYPKVEDEKRLKPHNQFMIVALGCGIPMMLVFAVWVFYPLAWMKRTREGFFMFAVWCVMFIPLMVEPFLELQFGVYVYLFYMLLHKHHARTNVRLSKAES